MDTCDTDAFLVCGIPIYIYIYIYILGIGEIEAGIDGLIV
jgi:hypothetical protein